MALKSRCAQQANPLGVLRDSESGLQVPQDFDPANQRPSWRVVLAVHQDRIFGNYISIAPPVVFVLARPCTHGSFNRCIVVEFGSLSHTIIV